MRAMASDAELLQAISRRDLGYKSAVAALYDRYRVQMLRFFRGFVSKADAEDLFHEAFIKIVSHASTVNDANASTAWIWSIARNCLYKFLRTKKFKDQRFHSGDIEEILFKEEYEDNEYGGDSREHFRQNLESSIAGAEGQSSTNILNRVLEDCVSGNLLRFREVYPDRYIVLAEALEGSSVSEIAGKIGRSLDATYRFMTESRKKLLPFIEPCRKLLDNEKAVA